MNSSTAFDVASKCEILVFIEVLRRYDRFTMADISLKTKVKNVNEESVTRWKEETKNRVLSNLESINNTALEKVIPLKRGSSWTELSSIKIEKTLPPKFLEWYKETLNFYTKYVNEQIRMAALYPRITSEILQFSDSDVQGHNYKDKNFLLTFDDGPTGVNGNTDKLIRVLDDLQLTAIFFVLGESLEKRLRATSIKSLQDLYGDNRVLSHGKVHKPHQNYAQWKESIDYTNDLIHEIFPAETYTELVYFRPPYGRRDKKVVDYFQAKNSKIILWNIDSRDWSSKLNVHQVANRQIKLMLLWRKGIVLFHDFHSKAQKVTPIVHHYFQNTDITWMKPF